MNHRKLLLTALASALWLAQPAGLAEEIPDKVALCAGCHGANGHSQVPDNPILAAQHPDYLVNALRAYVSGQRDYGIMQTLAGRLSEDEMALVAAYYAAQPPARSQASLQGDPARGKTRATPCFACHGAGGHSTIPANPNLAGQHAKYLMRALMSYKNGGRKNPVMASMAAALSEQDIADIAAYFAAQPVQTATKELTAGGQR